MLIKILPLNHGNQSEALSKSYCFILHLYCFPMKNFKVFFNSHLYNEPDCIRIKTFILIGRQLIVELNYFFMLTFVDILILQYHTVLKYSFVSFQVLCTCGGGYRCPQRPEVLDPPGSGVIGSCELLNKSAGNPASNLCKSNACS